jgi:serine/threonine protein kinase
MLSYIVNRLSYLQQSLLHFILQPFTFFSRIISPFIEKLSFANKDPNNIPFDIPEGPSTCETYTAWLQPQHDLDILGVGAAGQVYNVSDHVVLKTCRIFAPPGSDASRRDLWHYASDTLFHFNLLKNERTVLQLLQNRPHPHIIEAIDTHQPEGLYLRKYRQLPVDIRSTQARRIRSYRDIADALRHLHSLGIVHADVRVDNVLWDDRFLAILCDFSAASPCGEPNPVFPDLPLPVNGPSPVLSEASDMFALASLMFHMEHGCTPQLSLENGRLALPELTSGNQGIDEVIQTAWLGNYSRTSDMVHHLALIDAQINHYAESTEVLPDFEDLKNQVMDWRNYRKHKFGRAAPYQFLQKTTNLSLRMRPRRDSFRGAIESTGCTIRYGSRCRSTVF